VIFNETGQSHVLCPDLALTPSFPFLLAVLIESLNNKQDGNSVISIDVNRATISITVTNPEGGCVGINEHHHRDVYERDVGAMLLAG
jgi:hypothetical protein